jgi:hypothetical protein
MNNGRTDDLSTMHGLATVSYAIESTEQLAGRHLLYSFGGGGDYLVARRGGAGGVVLGVRAGLLVAPNRTTWTRGGQSIIAGPDVSPSGPFLHVVAGFGKR